MSELKETIGGKVDIKIIEQVEDIMKKEKRPKVFILEQALIAYIEAYYKKEEELKKANSETTKLKLKI